MTPETLAQEAERNFLDYSQKPQYYELNMIDAFLNGANFIINGELAAMRVENETMQAAINRASEIMDARKEDYDEMKKYAEEKREYVLLLVTENAKLNVSLAEMRAVLEKIRADIKKYNLDEQFGLEENDYIANALK
jgi:hypothetical protein